MFMSEAQTVFPSLPKLLLKIAIAKSRGGENYEKKIISDVMKYKLISYSDGWERK